jgi:hypothetical protein
MTDQFPARDQSPGQRSFFAEILDHNPKLPTFGQINKEAFNIMTDLQETNLQGKGLFIVADHNPKLPTFEQINYNKEALNIMKDL